jgi:hypothetical protein
MFSIEPLSYASVSKFEKIGPVCVLHMSTARGARKNFFYLNRP